MLIWLTDDVTEVLGVTGAGIALADDDGELHYTTANSAAVAALERVQEEHQQGPCAEAHRTQELVAINDIDGCADWVEYREEASRVGFRSGAGLPLSLGVERLGALDVYDHELREWAPEDLDAARVLADMAAGYLLHERLQSTRRLAAQLQGALDSRIVIEQAKGILAAASGLTMDEAFGRLRRHARNSNATLDAVARAVIEDGLRP